MRSPGPAPELLPISSIYPQLGSEICLESALLTIAPRTQVLEKTGNVAEVPQAEGY